MHYRLNPKFDGGLFRMCSASIEFFKKHPNAVFEIRPSHIYAGRVRVLFKSMQSFRIEDQAYRVTAKDYGIIEMGCLIPVIDCLEFFNAL